MNSINIVKGTATAAIDKQSLIQFRHIQEFADLSHYNLIRESKKINRIQFRFLIRSLARRRAQISAAIALRVDAPLRIRRLR